MNTQITLHYGVYQHIAPYWDGTTYYGTTWRLFYNETPGARVITRHEKVDMSPDRIYLSPPRLSFRAMSENNPKQLGIHFHASEPYDRAATRIYAVPLNDLLLKLLKQTLRETRPYPRFLTASGAMYATALTAICLTRIPEKDIQSETLDERIEEAMKFFCDHIRQRIDLEYVAEKVGLSKGAFIRLFKKETGSTPYAWLMDSRIAWACDLLTRDTIPIDLIAEHTGFNDRFHFSKAFKKRMGLAPAAYRDREPRPNQPEEPQKPTEPNSGNCES
ncbi:AraC family transcriptional regulator [Pontiella agarivorans]|uniref:AraC family transcriptional regulator n=1 Tax=Pontiella agarivorans TaxID=3038953 RepID=A0ABU5MTR1_9BACT|nr:AraC family transcriptional regulator [Pontiella agarivorans]MDZ8117558.1 AraC family transcriptional regulator [Pontiella agarivorans]